MGAAYFCTELIADLWQHCGLMSPRCKPSAFWPSDFGAAGGVEAFLDHGVQLGPETLLLRRRPEAAEATIAAAGRI